MEDEILNISEICPDSEDSILVVLSKKHDFFYVTIEPKEWLSQNELSIRTASKFKDQNSANTFFEYYVTAIAGIDFGLEPELFTVFH